MKLAKTIIICVLSCLLTLSVSLNIFTYTIFGIQDVESFKQVLLSKEILDSFTSIGNGSEDTYDDSTTDSSNDGSESDQTPEQQEPEVEDNKLNKGTEVFSEAGIIITYLEQEDGMLGPSFKFSVENNSDQPIIVSFTEVYIDGFLADLSGGSCYDLVPNKKAFLTLTIWESDYEMFTDKPNKIEYTIKIYNSETFEDIAISSVKEIYLN